MLLRDRIEFGGFVFLARVFLVLVVVPSVVDVTFSNAVLVPGRDHFDE